MRLDDLIDCDLLERMLEERYVSEQKHPTEPLAILNYTQRTQFDRVWNPVTRQCRGLIYNFETGTVVARPWPKFFNYGEHEESVKYDLATHRKVYPESDGHHLLDPNAGVIVTDKLDGSLGILYPTSDGHAIATRGSFTSDQALHATEVWRERYSKSIAVHLAAPGPAWGFTYLFEIIFPQNRIVVDYGGLDDLVLLGVLDNETGLPASPRFWPGPRTDEFAYRSLREALEAEPRPNCEGLVVYFPETNERLKLKQEDYVVLHRILTGTNARNVWEVAAVKACGDLIREPKHWGSFLGIDPARAEECMTLGDDWLAEVPDEFHVWVRDTIAEVTCIATESRAQVLELVRQAQAIEERRARHELVADHPFVKEIMRLASATDARMVSEGIDGLTLRCWREACPEPTAPFARSEAVA